MAANSLVFNIFGVDRTATKAIRGVAGEAEAASKKTAAAGGKVASGVALGIAALGAVSVESAVKFEKSITLLQTAAGESSKNLKVVSDGILAVSDKTGVSSADLAEGMFIVEKAMFRGADGVKVLQAAAEGAVAEGADMGTMTNALTSILSSYHLKASDAATVTSQMDRAAGLSKTTMQNFAGSLSTVLPIASAAGLSFAQVGGAIATLTAHGTSADESTQELNATIRALQAPNQVAQKEMNQLGINVADLTGNLGKRGLTGTLDIVVGALGKVGPGGKVLLDAFKKSGAAGKDMQIMLTKMTPSAKSLAQELLSGAVGVGGYTKTMKGLDVQSYTQAKQFLALKVASGGFNDVIKAGSPATQSAIDALKKMMGGSIGLNTALMLTGENAAPFAERVKEIAHQSQAASGDIATFAETQGTAAVQQAKLGASIHNLGIQIGTSLLPVFKDMLAGLAEAVKWLKENWSWVSKVALAALALAVAFKVVAAVVNVVSGVMKVFNLIMLANPIALVILAIAGLAAGFIYLWDHSKGFRDFWIGLWDAVKNAVGVAVGAVVTAFHAVIDAITSTWSRIGTFFSGLWTNITGWLGGLWGNLLAAGGRIVSSLVGGIAAGWHAVSTFFTGLWWSVTTWLASVWANLTGAGTRIVTSIVHGISAAWHAIGSWFTGLWANVTHWLSDIWHLMATSVGGRLIGSIVSGIASAWGTLSKWFTGLWRSIAGWVANVWNAAVGFGRSVVNAMSAGIGAVWGTLSRWFTGLWNSIAGWVGNVVGSAARFGWSVIVSIASGIGNAWSNLSRWFTGLWNSIAGWVGNVVGSAARFGWSVIVSIASGIGNAWSNLSRWFTGLWNSIAGWVGNVVGGLARFGWNLVISLCDGISSAWDHIAAFFQNLWSNIWNWVQGSIQGAFKYGADLANSILDGIGNLAQRAAQKLSIKMPVIGGGVVGDAFNASNHAKGGPLVAGTFGMVGEDGPEGYSVDANGRATIYSNPSTAGGLRAPQGARGGSGGGMGGGTTVIVQVQGLVGGTPDQLARQIADTLNQARRRGTIPKGAFA